ncbi:MAG: 3-keto-5-aminohexanoate cleavage protein [Pseudomonadota bacterium]
MKRAPKVIITCASTGSIHTPTMSPHLPINADDIAKDAIDAVEAGASILHLHARDPNTGQPKQDPSLFSAFLPRIKQQTNAVINITTGGGLGMPLEERIAPAHYAQPEVCSLNMGSMNFGTFELAQKYNDWRYDWEKPYLESSYGGIYPNTFEMIDHILTHVGDAYGTKFEFECYDIGHLYNLAYFVNKGRIKPPFLIQGIFGVHGGMGADPENLMHLKTIADKLFQDDYLLSVLAVGKDQMKFLTMSGAMGGNVRCGLEDSLFIGKGELAKSSAEQVKKIRTILEELGLEIATPDETRDMLALKGGDQVGF